MDQWHDFFLALAGTAGVLTGLVFVAVSINLQEIVSQPGSGLPGRAAEALILLVGVLSVHLAAGAWTGQGDGRCGGARGGARHLGLGRVHPVAQAAGLGDHEA